ncbi:hypothetical protein E1J38_002755 [Seonamhaeicola sediminis]|uniref:Uncharacterized protein n=1 Tax=Seonamhaeicola sediminis TaxID=2528206 RepID=A0A562YG20_9FLAO|nr:hypothetical protein [Seonamhaeicola sediminis]TWO33711.1 hypothetical protein E1J38_002755 [Seonamhaeicola sediminis]
MNLETNIQNSYQIRQSTFCKYVLVTPNKEIQLTFPQMLELRRKINGLTTINTLNKIINNENFVLLFVADKQHLIFLEIPQLLKLKEEIALFFLDFKPVLV